MHTFINFSNHPVANWDSLQKKEAYRLAGTNIIKDIAFPQIAPEMTINEIRTLAEKYVGEIKKYSPSLVMCQGEFTLCYNVVRLLKAEGIKVVAACSKRMVEETEDGQKIVTFKFEQFREY